MSATCQDLANCTVQISVCPFHTLVKLSKHGERANIPIHNRQDQAATSQEAPARVGRPAAWQGRVPGARGPRRRGDGRAGGPRTRPAEPWCLLPGRTPGSSPFLSRREQLEGCIWWFCLNWGAEPSHQNLPGPGPLDDTLGKPRLKERRLLRPTSARPGETRPARKGAVGAGTGPAPSVAPQRAASAARFTAGRGAGRRLRVEAEVRGGEEAFCGRT